MGIVACSVTLTYDPIILRKDFPRKLAMEIKDVYCSSPTYASWSGFLAKERLQGESQETNELIRDSQEWPRGLSSSTITWPRTPRYFRDDMAESTCVGQHTYPSNLTRYNYHYYSSSSLVAEESSSLENVNLRPRVQHLRCAATKILAGNDVSRLIDNVTDGKV